MAKREADSLLRTHRVYSYAATEFKPLHDLVLVRLEPRRHEDGLIVTVQNEHNEVQTAAQVIACGNDVREVKPGDVVACIHDVLSDRVMRFQDDPEWYEILPESAILWVVE